MKEHKGFRGTRVDVSDVRIQGTAKGATVSFRVRFADKNGTVHAVTNHEIEAATTPEIHEHTKRLMSAIEEWLGTIHFDTPSESRENTKKAIHGIAESLSDPSAAADDAEEQG